MHSLIETVESRVYFAAPPAVAALAASADSGAINVTWQDKAKNETGHRIQRSVNGVQFSTVATLPANRTSYRDAVSADTKYFYRVVPFNNDGAASATQTVFATVRKQVQWTTANDYLLQLQNLNLQNVGKSQFDVVIMDYANEHGAPYSTQQITSLTNSTGKKIALAYLSIGEAESYRPYWNDAWRTTKPAWLGPMNPDWHENYKVRFWMPGWQNIVKNYLTKIVSQGFDGVFLDVVDAYEFWADERKEKSRADAEREMVKLIKFVGNHARQTLGIRNFLVVQNNGEALVKHADHMPSINGIHHESVWFDNGTPRTQQERTWLTTELDRFRNQGKKVLVTDYVSQQGQIKSVYDLSRSRKYVPYATERDLDAMRVNTGFAPD